MSKRVLVGSFFVAVFALVGLSWMGGDTASAAPGEPATINVIWPTSPEVTAATCSADGSINIAGVPAQNPNGVERDGYHLYASPALAGGPGTYALTAYRIGGGGNAAYPSGTMLSVDGGAPAKSVSTTIVVEPAIGYQSTDPNADCYKPVIETCALIAGPVITTNRSNAAGWNFSETRVKGHNEFVSGGLHIWTDEATSLGKAAGYIPLNIPLQQIGQPEINFATASGVKPGMQLVVTINGVTGTLVSESDYYGINWWSNTDFGIGAGMGYGSYGTLDDYLAVDANAIVVGAGYSLGSGVVGDAVIESMTVGCTQYTFDFESDVVVEPAMPVFENAKCNLDGTLTFTNIEGVEYIVDGMPVSGTIGYTPGTTVVKAVAKPGYVFAAGAQDEWTFNFTLANGCGGGSVTPTTPPADNGSLPIVASTDLNAPQTGFAAVQNLKNVESGEGQSYVVNAVMALAVVLFAIAMVVVARRGTDTI